MPEEASVPADGDLPEDGDLRHGGGLLEGAPTERGAWPDLADLVASALGDVDGVAEALVGQARVWSRGGQAFVAVSGGAVELKLDPPIARAAVRTPDTSASTRGREWIRFAPRALDPHALDRLEAWLDLAFRRAAAR